jgi:hypothetical protein
VRFTDCQAFTSSSTDRTMVDAAATIPFGAEVDQDFVSRRVGNVVINPILGPLLDQIWVH